MTVVAFNGSVPVVDVRAFIAQTAVLIGDVTVGSDSSVWYGVVARGDLGRIVVGNRTNIQDGSVLHGSAEHGTYVADDVTVGHNCVIHGARILSGALIGNGSVLLDGVVVGERAIVAAGAVVAAGHTVTERSLVGGTPARIIRSMVDPATEDARRANVETYVQLAKRYVSDTEA